MISCLICNKDFQNRTALCNHLTRIHNINKKDYYDTYLKTETDGICKYSDCNNPTNFRDIEHGYADCCCLEHTNLYRYGVICNLNIDEVKEKAQKNSHTPEVIQKGLSKRIELYGGSGFSSDIINEKIIQTNLKKYGVDNPWKSQEVKDKIKQTKLERYGDKNYNNREKAKNTCLTHYDVPHQMKNELIKEKQKNTCKQKYGENYYMNTSEFREKSKDTCQEKYGTNYWVQSKEFGESHHKNHNKIEQMFIDLLNTYNISYKEEYKDYEKYPYFCDFYLPDTDTYIELHNYWMHRDHFFDSTSEDDIKTLEYLQEKAKEKDIYNKAIEVWTKSDIEKLECANRNHLNYVVLRTKEDINNWIESYIEERKLC